MVNRWLNVPIIVLITWLLCRELTLQNEYLRQENKILKSKIQKRITFTDDERRTLVEAAMAMGRDLMEQVVTIVNPKTILAWQRRLEKEKWDYSDRRKKNPGRPRIATDIEQLICRMARENEWGYKPRTTWRAVKVLPEGRLMRWMTFCKVLSQVVRRSKTSVRQSAEDSISFKPATVSSTKLPQKAAFFHYLDTPTPEVQYTFCSPKTGILRAISAMGCNGVR